MRIALPRPTHPTAIDEQARRLVAEVSEAVSRELRLPRLEQPLLGEIYLRVRERLQDLGGLGRAVEEEVEELALTIYLAWVAEGDAPGPEALVVLKVSVAGALEALAREPGTAVGDGPGTAERGRRRR